MYFILQDAGCTVVSIMLRNCVKTGHYCVTHGALDITWAHKYADHEQRACGKYSAYVAGQTLYTL